MAKVEVIRQLMVKQEYFMVYGNFIVLIAFASMCVCCYRRKKQSTVEEYETDCEVDGYDDSCQSALSLLPPKENGNASTNLALAKSSPRICSRRQGEETEPFQIEGVQPAYEELLPFQKPTFIPEAPSNRSEDVGTLYFSISYDVFDLVLKVLIQRAVNLPAKDMFGTSDPYVKIQLRPDNSQKLSTRIRMKNLNPTWNEMFSFEDFPHEKLITKSLHLQVLDYDKFSRDDALGEVDIHLSNIILQKEPVEFIKKLLPPKNSRGYLGDLLISTCFNPSTSLITIIVMKCSRLRRMDVTGKSDPYVKLSQLYAGRIIERKKTRIIRRSLNPVWNEPFDFEVPVDKLRNTSFSFSVKEFENLLPNKLIGKVTIGHQSTGSSLKHWNDMLNSPRKAVAMWHTIIK